MKTECFSKTVRYFEHTVHPKWMVPLPSAERKINVFDLFTIKIPEEARILYKSSWTEAYCKNGFAWILFYKLLLQPRPKPKLIQTNAVLCL